MNKEQLLYELNKLYDFYEVDKNEFAGLSKDVVARGVKGYLARLDKEKCKEYVDEHKSLIKDIFFYFG